MLEIKTNILESLVIASPITLDGFNLIPIHSLSSVEVYEAEEHDFKYLNKSYREILEYFKIKYKEVK